MIRNFFKVAIRNLLKSKGFSIINLLGLSIGMASAMLICIWIVNELRFEQFHEKKDRIYEVWNKAAFSGKMNAWNTTPKVLARTLEKDVPEVEAAVRVDWTQNKLFSIGEKRLMIRGNPVDSNFLQVLSFPLLQGNPAKALDGPRNLVITEDLAEKLFGTKDAMGKEVKVD
ncbi:MAG TPA: ABC transporter permease, partial [Phnomibacter sp.]|nr:ABC transporter permease [Phnomibacter sp.]